MDDYSDVASEGNPDHPLNHGPSLRRVLMPIDEGFGGPVAGVEIAVRALDDAVERLASQGLAVDDGLKATIFARLLEIHVQPMPVKATPRTEEYPGAYLVKIERALTTYLMPGRLIPDMGLVDIFVPGVEGVGGLQAARATEPDAVIGGVFVPTSTIVSIVGSWALAPSEWLDDDAPEVYEIGTSAGLRGWMFALDVFGPDGLFDVVMAESAPDSEARRPDFTGPFPGRHFRVVK